MSEQFFLSLQQNIKLMIWVPILSIIFRLIFMRVYNPYSTWTGRWKSVLGALRYGFWWGMDFDAYVFLVPLVFVTIPALWFDTYHQYGASHWINDLLLCSICCLCREDDILQAFSRYV